MKYSVLDHGSVELVQTWGDDSTIITSARVSTDGAFRGWGDENNVGDERLLKFLIKNKHVSTLEFCGMTVDIQCPMFVANQLVRHWSMNTNVQSARYGALANGDYVPTKERLMIRETENRQAMGSKEVTPEAADEFLVQLNDLYARANWVYEQALEAGIPKEVARLANTMGRYTKLRFSGVLRDWLSVVGQRCKGNAQLETREFANVFKTLLEQSFPRTMQIVSELDQ